MLIDPMLTTPEQLFRVAVKVPENPVSDAGRVVVVLPMVLPMASAPPGEEVIPPVLYTAKSVGLFSPEIVPPAIADVAPVLV